MRGQTFIEQYATDRLGDGDDPIKQPILGRHQPARLRVVDTPGVDHRHPR